MNVGKVLDTVEQSLLSRQLSCLERFILCQSWEGRGYSEMAADCAYSIAHIKDIGSRLWQALSKALGETVTKKNLFLVLKQYFLSPTGETMASDLRVSRSNRPTTNHLPVTTDLDEASYSEDSEQLPHRSDRYYLVTQEDEWLETAQQEYQTFTANTEAEDNQDAPVTQSEPIIPSDQKPLDSPLCINRPPIEELTYTEISQPRCPIRIKTPKLRGKTSLLSRILTRATAGG